MFDKIGDIALESSDKKLQEGFKWAKDQALEYAHDDDQVGCWYEAALPGRSAFCMRDISHQSTGANVLGLQVHNKNMLLKFAQGIAESRDWCSFWEINRDNLPAPVDYTDDHNFWYNLPANFDVLDCCYRQFLWTGDRDYLENPAFLNFYDRTVTDYVKLWDRNGDGLLEHIGENVYRGIASYQEDDLFINRIMTGADLVAAQYAGYVSYSRIKKLQGKLALSDKYTSLAENLKRTFNTVWWNKGGGRYYRALMKDGSFHDDNQSHFIESAALYYGIVEPGMKTQASLDALIRNDAFNVEGKSYYPEVLYKYGASDAAYHYLLQLMDPALNRREYPEVSYSVTGAVITGLMGLIPDAGSSMITTLSRLTEKSRWVSVINLPVLNNVISMRHFGTTETSFTNNTGNAIVWRACFPTPCSELSVNGKPVQAASDERHNFYVDLNVGQGQTFFVKML